MIEVKNVLLLLEQLKKVKKNMSFRKSFDQSESSKIILDLSKINKLRMEKKESEIFSLSSFREK